MSRGVEQDPDQKDFMGHAPFALKNRTKIKGKMKEKQGMEERKMEQKHCFGNDVI